MNKKKILFYSQNLSMGGVGVYMLNVIKQLDRTKYEIHILTEENKIEDFDQQLKALNIPKLSLIEKRNPKSLTNYCKRVISLRRILRKGNYDTVYFNISYPREIYKYPLVAKFFGIKKIILHSHNSDSTTHDRIRNFLCSINRFLSKYIGDYRLACSEKAADYMYGKNAKNIIMINNGIEVDKYKFDQASRDLLRAKLNMSDKFIIGTVGRITYQKNPKYVIDIFEAIYKLNPVSRLIYIGDGLLINDIKNYASSKGISDYIIFTGNILNVSEFYQAFDAFILPSLYEGFPIVGVEAQTAGLKCYFSDTITKQANLTGLVDFLSIKADTKLWAKKIISGSKTYKRRDMSPVIIKKHFDVNTSVRKVTRILSS